MTFNHMKYAAIFVSIIFANTTLSQRFIPLSMQDDLAPFEDFNFPVYGAETWENKLILVGRFTEYGDVPYNHIVAWNGSSFENFPDLGNVSSIDAAFIYQNQLIVAGNNAGIVQFYSLSGGTYIPMGEPQDLDDAAEAIYNGDLYISSTTSSPLRKWNGNNWELIEGSGFSAIYDLNTFGNYLYASGNNTDGLPRIARWDGNVWEEISGVEVISSRLFTVYNGHLYLCGTFTQDEWSGGLTTVEGNNLVPSNLIHSPSLEFVFFFEDDIYSVSQGSPSGSIISCNNSVCAKARTNSTSHWKKFKTITYNSSLFISFKTMESYNEYQGTSTIGLFQLTSGRDIQFLNTNAIQFFQEPFTSLGFSPRFQIENFHFPGSTEYSCFFLGIPWVGARLNEDTLVAAGTWINGSTYGWTYGPVSNSIDVAYAERYYRIWKVTQDEVNYHMDHYLDEDYVIPPDILDWPGNGNSENGEAHLLAPFVDRDGDTWYEAKEGDYPIIRGDECLLSLFSNHRPPSADYTFEIMSLDGLLYLYTFTTPSSPLNSSVFAHFEMTNRSQNDYEDYLFGLFNDWTSGPDIQKIGSDSTRSLAYHYFNQTPTYFGFQDTLFDNHPFAFGCKLLNSDAAFHRPWFASPLYSINEPNNEEDFYHYLKGENKIGVIDSIGGLFYYSDSPCSENPDVCEYANTFHLSVLSTATSSFPANDHRCYDFVYFVHHDTLADHLGNACGIVSSADFLQEFYESQPYGCQEFPVMMKESSAENFSLFPNPTEDYLSVVVQNQLPSVSQYIIYSMDGKAIQMGSILPQQGNANRISIQDLKAGAYLIRLRGEAWESSRVFIKD